MDKHIHVHTATVPGTPHDQQRMGDYWMIWYSHRSMSTHRVWQSEKDQTRQVYNLFQEPVEQEWDFFKGKS